ncbi:hypothetical protein niasHT_017201 [Heterodera trifolii]|uniref:adenine phosphoribosyltransferase n=1 Tax=Heterodera trifolii TaxID=157864 RepID=A0ABD2LD18_9BILA
MEEEKLKNEVANCIRSFPDFPTKDVVFRDIFPLFSNPSLIRSICAHIVTLYRQKIDVVVALEARGFLFGPIVALEMDVPFVPVRKRGKLPGNRVINHMAPPTAGLALKLFDFENAFIIRPTGGSLNAASQLISQSNAKTQAVFVIIELEGLNGRRKMDFDAEITSLLKYA